MQNNRDRPMPLRETRFTSQEETDDCCPGKPSAPGDQLADALQSQIINAFEGAIYQGMRPMDALAVILSWMSSEMTRIQAEQAKRSLW
jgi:hypothetical protein